MIVCGGSTCKFMNLGQLFRPMNNDPAHASTIILEKNV